MPAVGHASASLRASRGERDVCGGSALHQFVASAPPAGIPSSVAQWLWHSNLELHSVFRKQNGLPLRRDICGIFAGQADRMTSKAMPGGASRKFKRRGRVNVMPFDLLWQPLQELKNAVVLGQDTTNSCRRVQVQRLKFA